MTPTARLGGFKILKDVVRVSVVSSHEEQNFPAQLFKSIAGDKINVPYMTCVRDGVNWGLNIIVDSGDKSKLLRVFERNKRGKHSDSGECAILSIFPHRKNPGITGSLFEVFNRQGVGLDAIANSPSAISVVIKNDSINAASDALFEPFKFGAYRTPSDWKLAQKGKEKLYKEVVASYQEQKPKVYGLEHHDGNEFIRITLGKDNLERLSKLFKEFSRLSLHVTFMATAPFNEKGEMALSLCLPSNENESHYDMINEMFSEEEIESISSVSVFSMNGPHFGDRYGIASELLTALEKNNIELFGLSCTIASVTGVVPSKRIGKAIGVIQECFEVPTVIKNLP